MTDRTHATKLDRRSLERLWRVEVEKDSGPVLIDGSVLLLGCAGRICGVSVEDGRRLWGPTFLWTCMRWREKVLSVRPLGALCAATGAITETFPLDEDVRGDTSLCGDVIVGKSATSEDGDLVAAFDLADKRVLWKRGLIGDATIRAGRYETSRMMPAGGGMVLLGRQDWLFGCSVADGSILWDRPVRLLYYRPNVAEGRVYLLAGGRGQPYHLLCLDLETGKTIYDVEQPLVEAQDRSYGGTIRDDEIGFTTEGGRVVVFRLSDGAPVWWSQYNETLLRPCFVDGRVLVPAFDGNLLVFEPSESDEGAPGRGRASTRTKGPVLPCLKEAGSGIEAHAVCRPLWAGQASPYMPWVAFGYDRPHTFEFLPPEGLSELGKSEEQIELEALRNLRKRKASWETVSVKLGFFKKLQMLACRDDFLAAERILDAEFMKEAESRLKARGLLVGVPRRGFLVATDAEQGADRAGRFVAMVADEYRKAESAPISPAVFAVKEGAIVGIVEEGAKALVEASARVHGEAEAKEGEEREDEAAPYISTVVVRNPATGLEEVEICAAGAHFDRMASGVATAFSQAMAKHAARSEFGGRIGIVILAHTPEHVRKELPRLRAHLEGLAAKLGGVRVEVSEQQSDLPW